jgi:hypothetical protein
MRKTIVPVTFAKEANLSGGKRRNIGRKRVSRRFRKKSPSLYLIFLKELFRMG